VSGKPTASGRRGKRKIDGLSSALAGIALAGAVPARWKPARGAAILTAVAAALPDADLALRALGNDNWIFSHRGITHSLPGLLVLLLILAFAARPFLPGWGTVAVLGFAASGLAIHVILDWLNSWGPMLVAPFATTRYALDWMASTDIWAVVILGGGVAWSLARPARSIPVSRGTLGVFAAYVLLCAGSHSMGREQVRAVVGRLGLVAERIEAFPQPFSPFRWTGVAWVAGRSYGAKEKGDAAGERESCYVAEVGAFTGIRGRVRCYFQRPLPASLAGEFSIRYLGWARAPAVCFIAGRYPNEAILCDLRFAAAGRMEYAVMLSAGAGGPTHRWLGSDEQVPSADLEFELPPR